MKVEKINYAGDNSMDKYLPLFNYLSSVKSTGISLFFSEIENIINAKLPPSASNYREWWSNGKNSGHSQTFAWEDCGWQVSAVDFDNKKVYFEKKYLSVCGKKSIRIPIGNIRELPKPSSELVIKYLNRWENLGNYVFQESSLKKLFQITYPLNDDIDDVLIKVSALNDFYSTNIIRTYDIAAHIVNLNIDKHLKLGDFNLVDKIANVNIGGRNKYFYSFATKYCSHHNNEKYAIYDSFVEKVLVYFNKVDGFYDFDKSNLKIYREYMIIYNAFIKKYRLTDFSLKEIDRFLWQFGKEYFSKSKK